MPSYLGTKEKKDNKRRAEAFLKQEMDKPEKIQDHHLTGTDQPFLPFMEQWLNEVDQTIFKELVKTHEYGTELVFGGYDRTDESGADSVVLLAPEPYSQLYVYYLCAQIDMQNQEFDLYQNNAALYNKAYSDYASYYNRKIMPVSGARFNAWGVR